MRRIAVAVAAMALLAACGQAADKGEQAPQPQPNQADVTFTQRMIPHHQQAIEMADLIQGHTTRPELVELAGDITTTQGDEISRMQGWLRSWGKPADAISGMDHEQTPMPGMMGQAEMDELKGLKGARFDLAFIDMMTRHHQGAIEMANTELKDGSLPQVKQLAQQVISAQQREVSQLAAWKRAWAGPQPG